MSRRLTCDIGGEDFSPQQQKFWIEGTITVHDKYDDDSPHDHQEHVDICAHHSAHILGRPEPEPIRRIAIPGPVERNHHTDPLAQGKRLVDAEEYAGYMAYLESQRVPDPLGEVPPYYRPVPDNPQA